MKFFNELIQSLSERILVKNAVSLFVTPDIIKHTTHKRRFEICKGKFAACIMSALTTELCIRNELEI